MKRNGASLMRAAYFEQVHFQEKFTLLQSDGFSKVLFPGSLDMKRCQSDNRLSTIRCGAIPCRQRLHGSTDCYVAHDACAMHC
jgi:hypothetical protein